MGFVLIKLTILVIYLIEFRFRFLDLLRYLYSGDSFSDLLQSTIIILGASKLNHISGLFLFHLQIFASLWHVKISEKLRSLNAWYLKRIDSIIWYWSSERNWISNSPVIYQSDRKLSLVLIKPTIQPIYLKNFPSLFLDHSYYLHSGDHFKISCK